MILWCYVVLSYFKIYFATYSAGARWQYQPRALVLRAGARGLRHGSWLIVMLCYIVFYTMTQEGGSISRAPSTYERVV